MQLPRPGEILEGKYRLEEMLGEGAFGLVVKATTMSTNRPVAVKLLKPSKDGYKDSRAQRFMRELRVIAKLQCPNTLTLYDFGRSDAGVLYMVTEFVEGEDLYDLLERRGKLTEKETMHVLHQCLLSLSEAHEHGVLHRDIKPHNIRLSEYADDPLRVKVLDFGLSKTMEDDEGSTLTAAGIAVGTPRYMSPEQLGGKELGPKSDIYSLGLVTYEMLLGEPATPLDSVVGPRRRVAIDEDADVDPHLRDLINGMLKRSRRERYATAAEVLAALKLVRAGQPPTPPNPAGGFRTPTARSGRLEAAGASYDSLPRLATSETMSLAERQKAKGKQGPKTKAHGVNVPMVLGIAAAVLLVGLGLAYVVTDTEDEADNATQLGRRSENPLAQPRETIAAPRIEEPKPDEPEEQPVVVPSEGRCAGLQSFEPGIQTLTSISGLSRQEVLVYIPKDYDPTKPHPTIWFFHDLAPPRTVLQYMNHKSVEDLQSFVIIAPKTGVTMWFMPRDFDAVLPGLDLAREQLCLDPDRFYVWGHGYGGRIATRRAMCMDNVAAIATTNYRERIPDDICRPRHNVPYLHVGVTQDPVAPGDGGMGCFDAWINRPSPSLQSHEDFYKKRYGCTGEKRRERSIGTKDCKTWKCETPFLSCIVEGGRPLPGVPNKGPPECASTAADFPYVRTVYQFFSQFELARPKE